MGRTAVLFSLIVILLACGGSDPAQNGKREGPPVVYTTFYPTTYFAQRIGGDLVKVVCPLPEGEDAIFWQPDDETLAALQGAADELEDRLEGIAAE